MLLALGEAALTVGFALEAAQTGAEIANIEARTKLKTTDLTSLSISSPFGKFYSSPRIFRFKKSEKCLQKPHNKTHK